jgi:hypothetical protein
MKHIIKNIKLMIEQKLCNHKEFDQDIQIRVLRCKSCGKQSWLRDCVDLFKPTNEL